MAILTGYFDDSSDPKRQKYMAVGGIVGGVVQLLDLDILWSSATNGLTEPFRSTECETQHGQFAGWQKVDCDALMRSLVQAILRANVFDVGSIVPVEDYRAIFPDAGEYDPYFLALKHTLINMAKVGAGPPYDGLGDMDVRIVCEDSETTSSRALRVYQELKALPGWTWRKALVGFSTAPKKLMALQAADMVAREAYKHAANLGVRNTRKPVKILNERLSFHLWTRETLEYLRDNGGPSNLDALTNWGKMGPSRPQMHRFCGSTFDLA